MVGRKIKKENVKKKYYNESHKSQAMMRDSLNKCNEKKNRNSSFTSDDKWLWTSHNATAIYVRSVFTSVFIMWK